MARRALSTVSSKPLISITAPNAAGVAVLRLSDGGVNILSATLLQQLLDGLASLQQDPSTRAVVLSSACRVFSAGLDIRMFVAPPPSMSSYMRLVQDVFLALYPYPKPVIASIIGSAPAGGCWLSLLCDYRVMTDAPASRMGLNETSLGIVAPFYFSQPLSVAVGARKGEKYLMQGMLVSPQRALADGLVDELAPAASVEARAVEVAEEWVKAPVSPAARARCKADLRGDVIQRLKSTREAEITRFMEDVSSPPVKAAVQAYLASLTAKKTA